MIAKMSPPTPPPTILLSDVRTRNTTKSCYVTIGSKVYDVTEFLDDHPGGGDLILEYGGRDVKTIMEDEVSHFHSEAAYEILDDNFIGYVTNEDVIDAAVASDRPDSIVPLPPNAQGQKELLNGHANGGKPIFAATGMSSAEDLGRETDFSADYTQHKFLDLSKPLLMQVLTSDFSKAFYLEQVHRPRHYKGGASAPLFGNFLEPLSLTPWWVVPTLWLPAVAYGTFLSANVLGLQTLGYWLFGLGFWTIIEYGLHRFLFHIDEYVLPLPLPSFILSHAQWILTTHA
jgi:4-hydroxysphinganine ceramide fatty acyl 2-hydroxylase